VRLGGGLYAIGLLSHVDPTIGGEALTRTYLTQPMLMGHLEAGAVRAVATLNLEGLTLRDGELAPGNAGESWVDKRHPHTYLHELVASLQTTRAQGTNASLSLGRGFAPFGTDDPMVRPFVRYPDNHHWSQILERWVAIVALRREPFTLEAGAFNGDEPRGPDDLGQLDRFADSWAARATLRPRPGLELQGSYAFVNSPEHIEGFGLDQRKFNVSARLQRDIDTSTSMEALVEWAETYEYSEERQLFVFTTVLAEAALAPRPWRFALRLERTTRPEEERLLDPFRSTRPHTDENIIGATRWNTVTARAGYSFSVRAVGFEPFVEAGFATVTEIAGGLFSPRDFYGDTHFRSLAFGVRIQAGSQHARMGRYGAAQAAGGNGHAHDH
jgi:hypothetical protein